MKLNVVVDFPKQKDGIPRVAEELLKRISESNRVDCISIVSRQDLNFVNPSLVENKKVSLFNLSRRINPLAIRDLIRLYQRVDFLLFLAPPWRVFRPLQLLCIFLLIKSGYLSKIKWIQVLHDFTPYVCAEDMGAQRNTAKHLYNAFKRVFLNVPAKYVAVSESTKRDATQYWNLPADRIVVIPHGSFIPPKSPRTDFGSKKVLVVSDISPRKNHIRLIEAFKDVYQKNGSSKVELVIVGYMRIIVSAFEPTLSDIRKRNPGIKITTCGYLPDSDILSLYEQADVFVYPSLYEGFGLPVLEAMACGCPVITSNTSSLPEVVGDAGLLIDPYNVEELAQAMITVLGDDDLKREMSRKSIAQAQKFSWEKAAEEYITLFDDLLCKSEERR